ncbi:SAM-dependent methyltransferase [Helicobacter sp. MIT 14-3879]|uniref:SAM-dependent methyltransferase n=1 Tax=Helicobacter sp. MIT 14-3879 TaxID=2040649 RepID=UPI000E1EC3E0|nr:SAM-dependent methyltransferase [Helicobacter sp. MIT 14-3879]RDU61636.1 hypothetical protein CQA44_08325 [Helicobacter sp. MIT 14-3879]
MIIFSEYFKSWVSSYYKNAKIGKNGDFYTSVTSSKFFGGSIANYILKNLENGNLKLPLKIIDIGGNNLNLLNDIYEFLNAISVNVVENCEFILVESNHLVESSLKIRVVRGLENIINDSNIFFIANELFDALPCELFDNNKMAFIENNEIIFKSANIDIINLASSFGIKKGEIPLSYFKFCKILESFKFIFLVCDYGSEINRNDFSLRIFHKHQIINPFNKKLDMFFGKSDITYNVPFLFLDKAFIDIGSKKVLYKRQDLALVEDFGILDLCQSFYDSSHISEHIYIRESNKIKILLNELSAKFKIAIYSNFL